MPVSLTVLIAISNYPSVLFFSSLIYCLKRYHSWTFFRGRASQPSQGLALRVLLPMGTKDSEEGELTPEGVPS